MEKKQGIFISYRRDTGSMMSRMIYDRLRLEKGYHCFLDVQELKAGNFREKIKQKMSECDIFILVLSRNALDRCSNPEDNVRREIETAKEMGLTFIPAMSDDFIWPEKMPEGLEYIKDINAIPYMQVYSESFFERLYTFIESKRAESAVENETPIITPEKPIISKPGSSGSKPGSSRPVLYATKRNTLLLWITIPSLCFVLFLLYISINAGMTSRRSASAPTETASKPSSQAEARVTEKTETDTAAAETEPRTEADTAAAETEPETEPRSKTDEQYSPHLWGDYSPSGTAIIETLDGTRYTAIANSLVLKTDEVVRSRSEQLYKGLDNPANDDDDSGISDLISFGEIESVTRNGDKLDVVDIDGLTTSLGLLEEGEILFIGEKDTGTPTSVLEKDIRSITFDRSSTPPTEIKYCTVRLDSGFYKSPVAFLWFNVNANEGQGWPSMYLAQDLRVYAGIPLPVKRIQELIVTKNGNPSNILTVTEDNPHPEQTEMTIKLTTGEEAYIITGHYFNIYTMSAYGALREPSVSELRSIEMEIE